MIKAGAAQTPHNDVKNEIQNSFDFEAELDYWQSRIWSEEIPDKIITSSKTKVLICSENNQQLLYLVFAAPPFKELMGMLFDVAFWDENYSSNAYQRTHVCSHVSIQVGSS